MGIGCSCYDQYRVICYFATVDTIRAKRVIEKVPAYTFNPYSDFTCQELCFYYELQDDGSKWYDLYSDTSSDYLYWLKRYDEYLPNFNYAYITTESPLDNALSCPTDQYTLYMDADIRPSGDDDVYVIDAIVFFPNS